MDRAQQTIILPNLLQEILAELFLMNIIKIKLWLTDNYTRHEQSVYQLSSECMHEYRPYVYQQSRIYKAKNSSVPPQVHMKREILSLNYQYSRRNSSCMSTLPLDVNP